MPRQLTPALCALAVLACPASALGSGPSTTGAVHAVIHAVAEEGGNVVYQGTAQVHCRRIAPKRFGCSFLNLTRSLPGRATVSWSHGHYYVGEARYERPPTYEGLCGRVYEC